MVTLDSPIEILVMKGVEGPSLYINNLRVSGPKPWGGGTMSQTFTTTARNLLEAITYITQVDMSDWRGLDYDAADWHSEYRRRQEKLLKQRISELESEPWTGRR